MISEKFYLLGLEPEKHSKKVSKKKKKRVVYSTNPDFVNQFEALENMFAPEPPDKADQEIRIWLNRLKGNKELTVIKGLEETEEELEKLSAKLKKKCGSGGSVKNGEILIQGDHRDQAMQILQKEGYSNTKKAGG